MAFFGLCLIIGVNMVTIVHSQSKLCCFDTPLNKISGLVQGVGHL